MVNKSYVERAFTFLNVKEMLEKGETFNRITEKCKCSNSTVRKVQTSIIDYTDGDELIYNVGGKKISGQALSLMLETKKLQTLYATRTVIYNTTNLGSVWDELLQIGSNPFAGKLLNSFSFEVRKYELYDFLRHENHRFYRSEKS